MLRSLIGCDEVPVFPAGDSRGTTPESDDAQSNEEIAREAYYQRHAQMRGNVTTMPERRHSIG